MKLYPCSLSLSLLLPACLLPAFLPHASAQDYTKFNMSGMHVFRGAPPPKSVKSLQTFGRGFMATLTDPACALEKACREDAIAHTQAVVGDCAGHTFYPGLGLMGMVCFGPPSTSSIQSDKAVLSMLRSNLGDHFADVTPDKRVRLVLPQLTNTNTTTTNATATAPPPLPTPMQDKMAHTQDDVDGGGLGFPPNKNKPSHPKNNHKQEATIQATPYNWGRDRINQVYSSLDGRMGTSANKGKGARIYILDTGCRSSHVELRTCTTCTSSRATTQSVVLSNGYRPYGSGGDGNGHGTHCAGTAAGLQVGIAPAAAVKCIKVLGNDGGGALSYILAGMDMVAQAKRASPGVPMVVSLSLGSSYSSTVNNAVSRLNSLGVVVVVAAGNDGADAAYTSPASASVAITVGASSNSDRRTSWSNYGSVVDIYAPGADILSASNNGDGYYVRMSGTSMACPAVAGAVAGVMSGNPSANCSSSSTFVSKLRNPKIAVVQPEGNKPLVYLAEGSTMRCP